jgi:hypothetical protein
MCVCVRPPSGEAILSSFQEAPQEIYNKLGFVTFPCTSYEYYTLKTVPQTVYSSGVFLSGSVKKGSIRSESLLSESL